MGNCCSSEDRQPTSVELAEKYSLSAEQIAQFRVTFSAFDVDNDGKLSAQELYELLQKLKCQMSMDFVQNFVKAFDKKHSGGIDFEEFVFLLTEHHATKSSQLQRADELFDRIDKNKRGFVNADELKLAMKLFGMKPKTSTLKNMLAEADLNKDGVISRAEFRVVYMRWAGKKYKSLA